MSRLIDRVRRSLISSNSDHADDQVTYKRWFSAYTCFIAGAVLCAAFVSYTHFLSLKESFVYLLKVIAISCNAKITIQIPKDQFIYYCFVLFCICVCIWWTAFLAQHNSFPAQAIQLHLLYYTLDRTSIATIYATIATCNCHIAMTKSRSAYKSRSTLLLLLLWSLLPAY